MWTDPLPLTVAELREMAEALRPRPRELRIVFSASQLVKAGTALVIDEGRINRTMSTLNSALSAGPAGEGSPPEAAPNGPAGPAVRAGPGQPGDHPTTGKGDGPPARAGPSVSTPSP